MAEVVNYKKSDMHISVYLLPVNDFKRTPVSSSTIKGLTLSWSPDSLCQTNRAEYTLIRQRDYTIHHRFLNTGLHPA